MSSQDRNSLTKQCIELIRSLLSTPEFGAKCSSPEQLCEILQDGEILCEILAALSPQSAVGNCYYSVHSHLLAKRNILYFLSHCANQLGLDRRNLFNVEDLLELKNPDRVVASLCTLLKLRRQSVKDGELERVIEEICDHEALLVRKLTKLLLFRKELLGALSEWSHEMISFIFRHTEQLYHVHKDLSNRLALLAGQGPKRFCQQLHATLVEFSPRLEIYLLYFSHLPTAHDRLTEELKAWPELSNQLSKLEDYFADSRSFMSYFDAPIRQLPSHMLLLDRLTKVASKEAPDTKKSVEQALTVLKKLLDKTNSYKRQVDNIDGTKEVLKQIKDLPSHLANPAEVGLHLMDGPFKVSFSSTNQRKESYAKAYCVLTTKNLLVAAKAAKKQPPVYSFHVSISSSLKVKHCDATSLEMAAVDGNKQGIEMKLEQRKHKLDSNRWKEFLEKAQSECCPKGWKSNAHHFELKTFPAGTVCSNCKQCFSGCVLQGYACHKCNLRLDVVCLQSNAIPCGGLQPGSYLKYFHTGIDREQATKLLASHQPGAFLIREKSDNTGKKVLSVRTAAASGPVIHLEILEVNGKFSFMQNAKQDQSFSNLDKLIDYYKRNSLSRAFNAVDCKLNHGLECGQ